MTFVPFSLESPLNTSFTKYLPAAKPRAASTRPTQYSARSPTAPGLIPFSFSSSARVAFHASVPIPKWLESSSAARVSRYACSVPFDVVARILDREDGYVVEVRMTRFGNARGVKVAM